MIVAPSILSADFSRLGEEIKAVEQAGADWIHIDVMDGAFVPNITIGPCVVKSIRKKTLLPFDVHLMIRHPELHMMDFIRAGADYVTVHAEATTSLHRLVHELKKHCKVGVSLNPATPLCVLDYLATDIDLLLIMSVEPGFPGQSFILSSVDKIKKARKLVGPGTLISVDGGVTNSNVAKFKKAGANVVVAGSYVFGSDDYRRAIETLKCPD